MDAALIKDRVSFLNFGAIKASARAPACIKEAEIATEPIKA